MDADISETSESQGVDVPVPSARIPVALATGFHFEIQGSEGRVHER